MAEVLYNKEGYPMMAYGTSFFLDVKKDASAAIRERDILAPWATSAEERESLMIGDERVLSWGKHNEFPTKAAKIISSTSVLNTGLKFLRELTVGQGLFPCHVTGYDDKGNEILEGVTDKRVLNIVNPRMVRRYLEKVSRDYFKFGVAATALTPSLEGNIVGLQPINMLYTRFSVPSKMGAMKAFVSGEWPKGPATESEMQKFDVLMDYDPDYHLELLKKNGKLKKPVVFAIRDSWSNNDWYGEPVWLPAYVLGWVDIAQQVPIFLKKAYENQITWKWHIQIPFSYWEKQYPREDKRYDTPEKRQVAINKKMDEIEQNLCGVKNAEKPLFTHYGINEANGRTEEEWKITALDNKYKGGDNLVTSAAANSEILFALMVNPNVLGAGMPGGTYAGNQGGSNIREAFLVNIANAWIDRQNFVDPVYTILRSQGIDDVDLRFRNTVLTTLDSGAGTKRTLS